MNVDLSIDAGIARVTINRPERMNAVDLETAARLEEIWRGLEADPSLRCVVLTGAGEKAFSAGADMKAAGSVKSGVEYWADGNPTALVASRFATR